MTMSSNNNQYQSLLDSNNNQNQPLSDSNIYNLVTKWYRNEDNERNEIIAKYGHITEWNTSNITNMSYLIIADVCAHMCRRFNGSFARGAQPIHLSGCVYRPP